MSKRPNADLIAAAPDMLAVLIDFVAALDAGRAPKLETWDAARAAIAKAKRNSDE